MYIKRMWWLLLVLQIPIYGFFTSFIQPIPHSEVIFQIAISLSFGISWILIFEILTIKRKTKRNRLLFFILFCVTTVFYFFLPFFLGFFVFPLDYILMAIIIVLLIFTGKKFVFNTS